jgi:predicted dienelactone hydrolase
VFAIAPSPGEVPSAQTLGKVSIPVEMVAGAADPVDPPAMNAGYLAEHPPNARLTIYPDGVAHYTFLDTYTVEGKKQPPGFCVDRPGVNRDAIHAETSRKAVAFFDKYLAP